MQYQHTVKNSFTYKNKMLIKTNGAIKSIMNKNVQTNKLNFRIIIDKIVNLIKENQSHESIVCIVCKSRMWVSTVLLLF